MMMVIMVIEVVEDDSASSVKGGGVFLSFRRAWVESSTFFETNNVDIARTYFELSARSFQRSGTFAALQM